MLLFARIGFTAGAVALFTLGLLTVVQSPDWSEWRLAVVAGEFGHWFALVALAMAFGTWFSRGGQTGWALAVIVLSFSAGLLLLKPIVQARGIAQHLPAQLERDFGQIALKRPAVSLAGLGAASPVAVRPTNYVYAEGLTLDFYPATGRSAAPCVVVIHGGGWNAGDRGQIAHFNHWLVGRGYAVAAIDYRLAPNFPWPAQRADIAAAIGYLKSHAASLGIDATRLVLLGRSAGGHLAEAAAYLDADPAVRGVVALYAPADMHLAWELARDDDVINSPLLLKQFLRGTPHQERALYDSASPIQFVGKSTPPTLLIHGQLDTLVWHRHSERLAGKLSEAGVKHSFVSLPWATHGFEYNLNGPGGQLSTYAIEWFLGAVTR
jgi:acetyl esterase/lipase